MNINPWHHLVLIVFAVVFTVGLTFASLKIPEFLNILIIDKFDFPNIDPSIKPEIAETFIDAHHLRLIGYVCCLLLVTLMIAGFVTERIGLSSLGALGFYFPTFGYFSMHMFFLAGLGIFRVFWFPIWDQSLRALKLADIAYLPYMGFHYLLGSNPARAQG
jgi:hypothetical protein